MAGQAIVGGVHGDHSCLAVWLDAVVGFWAELCGGWGFLDYERRHVTASEGGASRKAPGVGFGGCG